MSLFNRQKGITYSMKEKIFLAWNLVGMFVVFALIYLLIVNFGGVEIRVPTDGIVELNNGSTLLYEGKSYCVESIQHYSSLGALDLRMEDGVCK